MTASRRLVFGIVLALGLAFLAEAGAQGFFRLFRDRFAFAAPEQYTLTPERIAQQRPRFDAELGWVTHYRTPRGERPHAAARGPLLMITFGDSHTLGDEVGDAETWQESLATELGGEVLNLGVSGYGVDQALLRSRRVLREVQAPVVGLGFVFENINRVVNRYRPFYFRATGIPLPKPRFILRRGRLELLPNPVSRVEDLDRLGDPAFIDRLGGEDYYYARAGLPRLGFPYARLLFSPGIWRQALAHKRPASDVDGLPAENLWRNDDARGVFLGILDAFVAEVAARGLRPVLLVLPGRDGVSGLRAGHPFPGYQRVLRHCGQRGYLCFDGIAPFAGEARDVPIDECFQTGGHSSARGNAILARVLARFLREHGLTAPTRGAGPSSSSH